MSDLVVIDGGAGSTDVTTPTAPLLSAWWDTTVSNIAAGASWLGSGIGAVVDGFVVKPTAALVGNTVETIVEGTVETIVEPAAAPPAAAPNAPDEPNKLPAWVIPAAVVVTVVVGVAVLATVARPRIPYPFGSFGRF